MILPQLFFKYLKNTLILNSIINNNKNNCIVFVIILIKQTVMLQFQHLIYAYHSLNYLDEIYFQSINKKSKVQEIQMTCLPLFGQKKKRQKFCSQSSILLLHKCRPLSFYDMSPTSIGLMGDERNAWKRVVLIETWRSNPAFGLSFRTLGPGAYVSCPRAHTSLWVMKQLQDHFQDPSIVQNMPFLTDLLNQCAITLTFSAAPCRSPATVEFLCGGDVR